MIRRALRLLGRGILAAVWANPLHGFPPYLWRADGQLRSGRDTDRDPR